MKIGILINARLGSKRLPKKHLRDIAGKMAIERLIERIACDHPIIISTGNEAENKDLLPIALAQKVEIFFGDQHNIPNRHLQVARKHALDAIISIDADDVLTSPQAIKSAIEALKEGKSLVRTEGLPLGMNVLWGYTLSSLINAIQKASEDGGSFDTGWGWIFTESVHRIYYEIEHADKIRATLDYPEDLRFFRTVYDLCYSNVLADDVTLCKWIFDNKIHRINKKYH